MKPGLLAVLWAWGALGAHAGSHAINPGESGDHTHGGSIEAEAIHAAAAAWKTTCDRLVVKTRPSHGVSGAIRVDVTHKKRPHGRPNPKYAGIVVDGELYMGRDAVHAAVLGLWGADGDQGIPAADLAWLAEHGGHCVITEGPTDTSASSPCAGHRPASVMHADGRVGVKYWLRCRGGRTPDRSQTKWVAWVNPDRTMEKTIEGSCSDGIFRPPSR